jgi:two-component system response regulator (stage 0 sporulation protein A)
MSEKTTETITAVATTNFTVESVNPDPTTELRVGEIFRELGIPAHIKGYRYARRAIVLAVEDDEILDSITKKLYPTIANEFKTTGSRVERAIRHAVEVSYVRGSHAFWEDVFGYTISFEKDKPTNSEFIATIADKIQMEHKYIQPATKSA